MRFSSLFIFLCLLTTVFYIIGFLLFLTDHEPGNNCEMTYMFEYPQYVRISQKLDEKYPKYGLYVYAEGRITKKARNMQFNGIPVLFICGNAGSYKQVRSLASIALRKTLNSGTPYHFDYFTVDLNNEFSGLYGPLLYEEFDYIAYSLKTILNLYNGVSNPPQKIILIGHSMGGVIAKRITGLLYEQNLISVVITLASPLKRNVLYFDRYASKFYKTFSSKENNFININIAGGYSDFLVPASLSNLKGNNTLNLVTSNIPKSWVEGNHIQILWCKQTVMAINRALFDSVDLKTLQISSNVPFITDVFRHHLLQNSGGKIHHKKELTKLDPKGEWIASIKKQYTIEHAYLRQNHWYMVSLTALPTYEMLTILTVNLETSNWIFACNAAYPKGYGRAYDGEDLTSYSEIVPSIRHKRRLITLNLHEIRKNNSEFTHVVFRSLPTSEPVTFHVDIYGTFERRVVFTIPIIPFRKKTIVAQTPEKALSFDLIFPELVSVIQSYQLYVEPIKCSSNQHHASASLIVPWSNEMVHTYITEGFDKPLILRLQSAKPVNASDAKVRLILEPSCVYEISIKFNLLGVFANMARYYSPFLLTHTTVVFLLVFQNQIHKLGESNKFPLFFTSLFTIINYSWLIIIATGIISNILSYTIGVKFLPEPDIVSFPNDGNWIDFLLLPLFLHMVSIIFVFMLVSVFSVSLFTLESTVNKLTLKFLAKTITLTIRFSDYFMTFLQKVPIIVSALLIFLCFTTCGALALCVGMVFYFLKLTKMSQDYVEKITWFLLKILSKKLKTIFSKRRTTEPEVNIAGSRAITENSRNNILTGQVDTAEPNRQNILKDIFETNSSLFFHSSMFFIWFTVMALNIPAVLTWAHNFKYSRHLSRDESFLPGLFLSISATILWQFDLPSNNKRFIDELRLMTLYCTIIILIYGTISVYVVNYLLTILFVLVVLQQYYNLTQEQSSPSNNMDNTKKPEDIYDEMRMKLD
ncbi:GPI inositol-deacylase isoform X1 [Rhynchophorus ferrugineus]|uniref:GPI inositol-deacylase isoform X1 n=1 Tax=Rhynchophorus ferrugineus TaxID=354439 RepID=UPI003FCDA21E